MSELHNDSEPKSTSKESSYLELITKIFAVNYIKFESSNWKLSVCSCGWWNKHFICRHVIVVAVKMGLAEFPEQATTLLLNQTRKRGRPLNNTAALIRQPSEAYSQAASSTARRSNSTSSTDSSVSSPLAKKQKKKSSQFSNPSSCPSCGDKMLKKKGFYCKNKCNKK